MSELNASNLRKEKGNEGPDLVGLTELTSPYYMVPPSGTTAERPQNPQPGTLRFNTDIGSLEHYRGDKLGGWESIDRLYPNFEGGARGLFMGGSNEPDPSATYDIIEYITIPTCGNGTDFGNLTSARQEGGAFASSTRGVYFGGDPGINTIEYVTFATTGNAINFGDTTGDQSKAGAGAADQTRGLMALGWTVPTSADIIEYVTTASTGNARDFGNLSGTMYEGAGFSSSTRGIFTIGYDLPSTTYKNTIDYVTIQTLGNATDFGDLTLARGLDYAFAGATRGIICGGYAASPVSTRTNTIDFITIATTGNAMDFGDMTTLNGYGAGCSSKLRGVCASGYGTVAPTNTIVNTMEYVEIATTGNSVDFGDVTQKRRHIKGCSNAHGGL